MCRRHAFVAVLAVLAGGAAGAAESDLLVLMHETGRVERYDALTGEHLGTFVRGLTAPNELLEGPDGMLYVSTGTPGRAGAVERFDAATGRKVDTFVAVPEGQPGHLARATGMAWLDGDLLVASQGDGKVHRYDGKTGAWKAHVATASPGGTTQLAVRDGRLYLTDFAAKALRVSDLTDAAGPASVLTEHGGQAPWGVAFDGGGRLFWSTNGNQILAFDGRANAEWAGADGGLDTPVGLAVGPDGRVYAANLHGSAVSVWAGDAPNPADPLLLISGGEVRGPIAVAFSAHPFERPVQIGGFAPEPSNTGRDWVPDGTVVYNLRADKNAAALPVFGVDTEGGDRAKTNLLREPIRLVFTLADGRRVESSDLPAAAEVTTDRATYRVAPAEGVWAVWAVRRDGQNLTMDFSVGGPEAGKVAKAELLLPFDPRAMGTTVLAEGWGEGGAVTAPLIVSALDMGQLRLSDAAGDGRLGCTFTGSRQHKRVDLRVAVLDGGVRERTIVFAAARLRKPRASIPDAEWARVRRGLISLLHVTPFVPPQEDGSGWLGSPGGVIGNNVISDPVSCCLERNLQWLAGMGEAAVVDGIDLNKVAVRTIEFWLNRRRNADGSIDYVLQTGNISADSNTGILNAATDYYLATGDRAFVERNKAALLKAATYLVSRDVDGDGLIETFRNGNGGRQFGDTAYDTVSSGWKNALVNGQAYKSFLGVGRMMADLGEAGPAEEFRRRAARLRVAYNRVFYDAAKGRYVWWIGADGRRHDYGNPLIQSNAVLYGIADGLAADAGVSRGPREVMRALWDAFEAAEYFDSAKGRKVDFIDGPSGDHSGFYWGVPCNLESVPPDFNYKGYGEHEFPYYCNGGIFPQDAVATIAAFCRAGLAREAEVIRKPLYRRQHEGILPNGSGFYMGVVNLPGRCYSILKWDGTPTDYEGIISRDCSFLQTTVLADDPARPLFDEALVAPRDTNGSPDSVTKP